ncbi:hypothetical protein IWX90DRAFT_233838 [Phyllosticta citrichinensis]|uniref:Transmembrane protein n=1 Tax=Phyllosticta citrichinensis TaxID=1130410 RepID=A0ABR1XUV5_9PEZI
MDGPFLSTPTYLPTYLHACLPACLPACLSGCLRGLSHLSSAPSPHLPTVCIIDSRAVHIRLFFHRRLLLHDMHTFICTSIIHALSQPTCALFFPFPFPFPIFAVSLFLFAFPSCQASSWRLRTSACLPGLWQSLRVRASRDSCDDLPACLNPRSRRSVRLRRSLVPFPFAAILPLAVSVGVGAVRAYLTSTNTDI